MADEAPPSDDDDGPQREQRELERVLARRAGKEKVKLPRRGEKGFAPTGAQDEEAKLKASRELVLAAMRDERRPSLRVLSIADWDAARNMARVTQPRGNVLMTMGRAHRMHLYLLPEETAYLVERGVLQLLVDGEPASLQQTMSVCFRGGFALDKYVVYCYFRRLGYIVTRHGLPWTTLPSPEEAASGVRTAPPPSPAPDNDDDNDGNDGADAMDAAPAAPATAAHVQPGRPASLLSSAIALFTRTAVSVGGWMRDVLVRRPTGQQQPPMPAQPQPQQQQQQQQQQPVEPLKIKPLLDFSQRPTPEEVMQRLQLIPVAKPQPPTFAGDALIAFDIYRPTNQFSKKNPPPIAFKLFVARYSDPPPDLHTMLALLTAAEGVPLRVAVVHGATITFYSLVNKELPHHAVNLVPHWQCKRAPPQPQRPRQGDQQREKPNKRRKHAAAPSEISV